MRTRTQWGLGVQSPGGRNVAVEAEAGTQATDGAKGQEQSELEAEKAFMDSLKRLQLSHC